MVLGLLEREAQIVVAGNTRRRTLQPEVRKHVEPGPEVFVDALASYIGLDADYVHGFIDHAECYADGKIHTNGLENFRSLLKRAVNGTYVAVEPFHLFRYPDEQTFRYDHLEGTGAGTVPAGGGWSGGEAVAVQFPDR